MMHPIEIQSVTKRYGHTTALADVSLAFEVGEVHALVGPNGAGKTTLFRVLLGLTRPDSGTVSVPDVPVGCAFQEPRVYGTLTVQENLDLFAGLTDAATGWVETLVDRCGLERVLHRRAGALSAGFANRLELAVAMVDRPRVLLLDEPLADVDDEYRSRIRAFLADYASDDRLLVLATHQFDSLTKLVDVVTVIDGGRVRGTERATTLDDETAFREFYTGVLDGGDEERL